MSLFSWIEARVKKLCIWDISLLKINVFTFALTLAILWPALLKPGWKIYGSIFLVTYVYLIYKFFIKK